MDSEIKDFLNQDEEKIKKLIKEHPDDLPVAAVAELLDKQVQSIRAMLDDPKCPFGISWRKDGKLNKGYCIPKATFVRWYLNIDA